MKITELIEVKPITEVNAEDVNKFNPATGNVLPLLFEVRHALARWLKSGEQSVIDLRRIPLMPNEEELIEQALGEGEVTTQLIALGKSLINETGIAGVWMLTHYNNDDQIVGKTIEVTDIPSILKSQPADMRQGLKHLDDYLSREATLQ